MPAAATALQLLGKRPPTIAVAHIAIILVIGPLGALRHRAVAVRILRVIEGSFNDLKDTFIPRAWTQRLCVSSR